MAFEDLLSYYKCDEGTGQTGIDSQSTNHLLDNGVSTAGGGEAGILETARTFNFLAGGFSGARLRASADSIHNFGDEDFTITCWASPIREFTDSKFVVSKWDAGASDRQYAIQWNAGTAGWRVLISGNGIASTALNANESSDSGTNLQFLVFRHNATEDWLNFSVNGASPASIAHSGGANQGTGIFALAYGVGGGGDDYGDLLIDEVAVFGSVLSGDDEQSMYNGGAGLPFEDIVGGGGAADSLLSEISQASRPFVVESHLEIRPTTTDVQTYTVVYREINE